MDNISSATTFILKPYEKMELQNDIYLVVFLLPYILTIALNTLLIVVIYKERTLHKPMYIFICNLSCNGIYGSTTLFPHVLTKLATKSYTISLANCFIQIYCLHTWGIIELMTLSMMGYDRYIAICTPLHYHENMSPRKVKILIAISWIFPLCTFPLYLVLTIRLSFCNNIINKIYCVNYDVVTLSCTSTFVNNIVGLLLMGVYMFPQLLVILFSYAQILRVCIHASTECRRKAIQTCVPHLLTVINYFFGALFEFINARLRDTQAQFGVALFLSLYFMILQPLIDPLMYGSSALKLYIVQFFQKRKLSPSSKR